MKRTLLALILATVAFFALSYFTGAAGEVVVAPGAASVLLAAALVSLALWLSRIGVTPDESSGATAVAVLLGVAAAAVAVIVASFIPPFAADLDDDELVRRFRILYYENQLFKNDYLGIRCLQYPTDQWVMQEIIADIRPDFIVETGTWSGATTLFYAHLLEKLKPEARIITVDIEPHGKNAPRYPAWDERVEFILGDSVSDEVVGSIEETTKEGEPPRRTVLTPKGEVLTRLRLVSGEWQAETLWFLEG